MTDYSIYLHIPFCKHRCAYCDFNTYSGKESLIPDYVRALCLELEFMVNLADHPIYVQTIFFGGGTPSLLPTNEVERIFQVFREHFLLPNDVEITLEANPGTLSRSFLQNMRTLGINRLSLGMQSANPRELMLLERQHSPFDVIEAVNWARQVGYDNINLDPTFGLPYQAGEDLEAEPKICCNSSTGAFLVICPHSGIRNPNAALDGSRVNF